MQVHSYTFLEGGRRGKFQSSIVLALPNHQPWYAKVEAQLEYVQIARFGTGYCKLSRCLATKFLHCTSGGRVLRVRCWLGCSSEWSSWSYLYIHIFFFLNSCVKVLLGKLDERYSDLRLDAFTFYEFLFPPPRDFHRVHVDSERRQGGGGQRIFFFFKSFLLSLYSYWFFFYSFPWAL